MGKLNDLLYAALEGVCVTVCINGAMTTRNSFWFHHFVWTALAASFGGLKKLARVVGLDRSMIRLLDDGHTYTTEFAATVGTACAGCGAFELAFGSRYHTYFLFYCVLAAFVCMIIITGNGKKQQLEQMVHAPALLGLFGGGCSLFFTGNYYLLAGTVLLLSAAGAQQAWRKRRDRFGLDPDDVFHILFAAAEVCFIKAGSWSWWSWLPF
eukprot:TRINITY_DN67314_c4_g1_i3.p1 TRINITY_DN67314_c4_g1~~TRINITY_DN67314_c4_g1_i3.p1  ORF type:complete len:210 (-),score=33.69 TRINITY_DN67314_c4_g1_i3:180-809(-)